MRRSLYDRYRLASRVLATAGSGPLEDPALKEFMGAWMEIAVEARKAEVVDDATGRAVPYDDVPEEVREEWLDHLHTEPQRPSEYRGRRGWHAMIGDYLFFLPLEEA